jgi:hypothetical protein
MQASVPRPRLPWWQFIVLVLGGIVVFLPLAHLSMRFWYGFICAWELRECRTVHLGPIREPVPRWK